ncbi:hypothetical protein PK28_04025 [Hymenobacter sp. DG25B]|nr:hypothetical protein PK28_04025 [Hymenobacter sp. DG25B]
MSFVKYESKGETASFLAGSPIISDLYQKICERIWEMSKGSRATKNLLENGWPLVKKGDEIYEIVNYHLRKLDNWDSLDTELKAQTIKDYLGPYKAPDEVMAALLNRAG